VTVQELIAKLTLRVDKGSFATAAKALDTVVQQVRAGAAAALASVEKLVDANGDHFNRIVLDTMRAARTGVDDAVVSWDGWTAKQKESVSVLTRLRAGWKELAAVALTVWAGSRMLTGLQNLVQSSALAAANFERMSQRTGVGVERFQELAHAAKVAGVETDNFVEFLQDLQEKAFEAARGQKEYADAYRALGVNVKDSQGKLRSGEQLMRDVADRFSQMEDGGKKTALAMKLFSDEGTKIIPLLNKGSKGIDEMALEARTLGVVLDRAAIRKLKELNAQHTRMAASLTGLKNDVLLALLPTLHGMVEGVRAWVAANRTLLKQRLAQVFGAIAKTLIVLGKTLGVVIKVVDVLVEHWRLLGVIASTVIAGKLVMALGALRLAMIKTAAVMVATAIKGAAAWALASLPLLLLGALVTGLALLVEDFMTWKSGGDSLFGGFYADAVNWLSRVEKRWQEFQDFIRGEGQFMDTRDLMRIAKAYQQASGASLPEAVKFAKGQAGSGARNFEDWQSNFDLDAFQRKRRAGTEVTRMQSFLRASGGPRMMGPSPAQAGAWAGMQVTQSIGTLTINEAGNADRTREAISDALGGAAQRLRDTSGARSVP
jgi:hypothetical protein